MSNEIVYTSPEVSGRFTSGVTAHLSAQSGGTVLLCCGATGLGVHFHMDTAGARELSRQLIIAADAVGAAQGQAA